MTRFEFETAELVRLDRRLLADIGLLGGDEPHPDQLHKLPAKTGAFDFFINLLLSVVWTSRTRDARVQ
jgi:hypothetical protein